MLVLTRRDGQALTIGDDIVVRVIGVNGRWIRLGIEAPKNKKVLRLELHNQEPKKKAVGKALGEAS